MQEVFGICGFSGSGKTTLLCALLKRFAAEGLEVATVKHASPQFDTDKPGKDSHSHRSAGAKEVLVASRVRWALVHEHKRDAEWPLRRLLTKLSACDLVLVEGFKNEPLPKLEVFRPTADNPPAPSIWRNDPHVKAVAVGGESFSFTAADLPVFDLDDTAAIAEFIKANAEKL